MEVLGQILNYEFNTDSIINDDYTHIQGAPDQPIFLETIKSDIPNLKGMLVGDPFYFLESRGLGPNIAAYVGHSSVRVWVMGEEAM